MKLISLAILLPFFLAACDAPPQGESSEEAAGGAGVFDPEMAPYPASGPIEPITTTIDDLVKAYDENEAAAQLKLRGQWIDVTGKIERIDLDHNNIPVLWFEGDIIPSPHANFAPEFANEAIQLKKGGEARLLCRKIGEIMGSPSLDECQLLTPEMIEADAE